MTLLGLCPMPRQGHDTLATPYNMLPLYIAPARPLLLPLASHGDYYIGASHNQAFTREKDHNGESKEACPHIIKGISPYLRVL